jgi:hypothetical protein
MAIDQTDKRRNLATQIISRIEPLMDLLYELDGKRQQAANITFVDADFTGVTSLKQIDAAAMNLALTKLTTLRSAMTSQGIDTAFEALRR